MHDVIVWVFDCEVDGHANEPHGHVRFVETCMHGQPLRRGCNTCEFGTNPFQCPDCGYAYDAEGHLLECGMIK